jgi:hypothetical protein
MKMGSPGVFDPSIQRGRGSGPSPRVMLLRRRPRIGRRSWLEGKYQVLCHDIEEYGGTWLVVQPDGEPAPQYVHHDGCS